MLPLVWRQGPVSTLYTTCIFNHLIDELNRCWWILLRAKLFFYRHFQSLCYSKFTFLLQLRYESDINPIIQVFAIKLCFSQNVELLTLIIWDYCAIQYFLTKCDGKIATLCDHQISKKKKKKDESQSSLLHIDPIATFDFKIRSHLWGVKRMCNIES